MAMEKVALDDVVRIREDYNRQIRMRLLANDEKLMKQVGSYISSICLLANDEASRAYCENLIRNYNRLLAWREFDRRLEPKITSWINKLNHSLVRYLGEMV
jgi:hypothetical protein